MGKKKDKFRKKITLLKKRQTEKIVRRKKGGGRKSKKIALVRQQVHVFCLSIGKQKKKQQHKHLICDATN